MGIPLPILFDSAAGLRLIGGNDLAVRQLGGEVHAHFTIGGLHAVSKLEGADLRPGPLIVPAGDGPLVVSEITVAHPPLFRTGELEEPPGRLAGRTVVTAGSRDVAGALGSGISHHASRRLCTIGPDHAGIGDGDGVLVSRNMHLAARRRVGRAGGEGDESKETKDIGKEDALPVTTVLRAHDEPPSPCGA